MPGPRLTLQTASLYASGAGSTFSGTGGPFGWSPFTGQFGGVVGSAGLVAEPFDDVVYDVGAGDEVAFVIAVQNLGAGAAAWSVRVADAMPAGFSVPAEGLGLTVTDGAGTPLGYAGTPFDVGGLALTGPIPGYDATSGLNLALITFSLVAGNGLPGPTATLTGTASVVGFAASAGGPDVAAGGPIVATTTVVTTGPTAVVRAETDPGAVARGQTIAFDVSVTIPAGSVQDLRITPAASAGPATLEIVGASVIAIGAGLRTGTPVAGADGSLAFGSVSFGGASGDAADNVITARIVVRAAGDSSGTATLHTVVSAAGTGGAGRWTADVASSVGVVAPPPPPHLSGLGATHGTPGVGVHPYAALTISGTDPAATGTLAITLLDAGLGRFAIPTSGSLASGGETFVATGPIAELEAAARALTFIPGVAGTAHLSLTVIDAAGGVAQDGSASVAATDAVQWPQTDFLFDTGFYLAGNPDVAAAGVDPYQHFLTFGWREGRAPDPLFDPRYYLAHNPDVAAAGVDPLLHYETFGWHEGRDPSLLFSTSAYLAAYPDVAAAGLDPLEHYLRFGHGEGRLPNPGAGGADPLVDAAYFANQVGASLAPDPAGAALAFHQFGWQAGRNPSRWFDTQFYLARNPDVAAAHVDPLQHFETFGWREGRDPSAQFSTARYLAAYPDVRAAEVDPLLHYTLFGQAEGRQAFAA